MRFFSNKKAVSNVVSTLMIVSIIFAMFAIIYPWSISSLTKSQSMANIWYSRQEEIAQERFVVEMAYFNSTAPESIDVYLRNVGDIDINISEIYIDGVVQTTIDPVLPEHVYIKTNGSSNVVVFTVTYSWDNDETYRIKIVTERGETTVYYANAPA